MTTRRTPLVRAAAILAATAALGCASPGIEVAPVGHTDRASVVSYGVQLAPAGGRPEQSSTLVVSYEPASRRAKVSSDDGEREVGVTGSGHLARIMGELPPVESFYLLTALPKEAGPVGVGTSWQTSLAELSPVEQGDPDFQFEGTVVSLDGQRAVIEQQVRFRSGPGGAWRLIGRGTWVWSGGRLERGTVRWIAPIDLKALFKPSDGPDPAPELDTASADEVVTVTFTAQDT
ncbi:MAG: hypothetical protein M9894_09225 [Planctomycetes bacterium]|nr:hypothetical protein [Planctomycetota bacterium]